jgi:hypothetical protein
MPILGGRTAEDILHANMVCGSPFEYQLPSLDIYFLEQAMLDPAALAKSQFSAVCSVFLVYRYKRRPLWGDAELVRVSFETFADRVYGMGNLIGGVKLKSQCVFVNTK